MKIHKCILFVVIFSIVGICYKFGFRQQQQDSTILRVGTCADYHPYEFINTNTGQIEGFDIDLVQEIARRLGKKMVLKDMPFTSLIFGLSTDHIDMIAAGMSPTEQRAQSVLFTDRYLQGQPLVILTKSARFEPKTVGDLAGKTVAVNTGFIADLYMSKQPDVTLIKLDSPADCFLALQSGTVDAFVCAQASVQIFLQKTVNPDQYGTFVILDTGEACAFAVRKNNTKLMEEINQTLDAMQADGTLVALQQKWKLV